MSSYYSVDYCGTARNKRLHTSTSSTRYCAGETEGRRSGQGWGGRTHMDGPPRHGTESVPSRLRLCGCWSLLAAEPAVHEDHTQCLSQIPHRFWFWAPTDTRFGGKRGAPGCCIRTRHVRVSSTVRVVHVHTCTYGVINLIDQSAGTDPTDSQPKLSQMMGDPTCPAPSLAQPGEPLSPSGQLKPEGSILRA